MTSSRVMRWIVALSAIVLGVAIAIGVAIVAAWSSLPIERAALVLDGESVRLPSLTGWHAALALVLAVFAVLVAAVVTVGAVALALAAALCGILIATLVIVVTLLLVLSPVLLIGWLLWRLARSPSAAGGRAGLA
ncbi:MAG: hypothetical protein ABIQ06_06780 [Caldimonas sp.]